MKYAALLIATLFLASTAGLALAAASPTPTPSATHSTEQQKAILEHVKQLMQDGTPERNSAYIGTIGVVVKVGNSSFTINDSQGRQRTVLVNPTTPIFFNTQAVQLKDVNVDYGAAIIGTQTEDIVIDAKRVYLVEGGYLEKRQVSLGTITTWKNGELGLTLRGSSQVSTWNTDKKVRLEDSLGTIITAKDIQPDQAALIITNEDSAGTRKITRIHLLAPVQSPTPGTTPKATPKP